MDEATRIKKPIFDISALNLPESIAVFSDNKQSQQQTGEKFIVFISGSELFAISSKQVEEVTQMLPLTRLPNTPEWLLGIANLRGTIICVADLPKILKKRSVNSSIKAKFVIVRHPKSDYSVAFVVDKISELITLSNSEIQTVKDTALPFISGKIQYKAQTLHILDSEKILTALRLAPAESPS